MTTYTDLGVRPFINASGTITTLGGSLMRPEVLEAMLQAARAYVDLNELHLKAGERLAQMFGVPAAFISAGAASGIQLSAAACLTGTDREKIRRLPHTEGKNEFVISQVDPSTQEFLLGTDNLGRDILSRLLHGSRPSIGTAAIATILVLTIGISLGVWSGYAGGFVDELIMRIVDVFLAFPSLLLAIAIVGMLGPSLPNVIIGAVIIWWAGYARLVRGLVLEMLRCASVPNPRKPTEE